MKVGVHRCRGTPVFALVVVAEYCHILAAGAAYSRIQVAGWLAVIEAACMADVVAADACYCCYRCRIPLAAVALSCHNCC